MKIVRVVRQGHTVLAVESGAVAIAKIVLRANIRTPLVAGTPRARLALPAKLASSVAIVDLRRLANVWRVRLENSKQGKEYSRVAAIAPLVAKATFGLFAETTNLAPVKCVRQEGTKQVLASGILLVPNVQLARFVSTACDRHARVVLTAALQKLMRANNVLVVVMEILQQISLLCVLANVWQATTAH